MRKLDGFVGLYFYVDGDFLLCACPLKMAQAYGDFLNYPLSHDEVWERRFRQMYAVDFDYYPRGRMIYDRARNVYIIYYDGCIADRVAEVQQAYAASHTELCRDEYYQCHLCNQDYHI